MSYTIWTKEMSHPSLGQSTLDWIGVDVSDRLEICKVQEPTKTILTRCLPRHGLILEAGCGLGSWVIFLERLGFNILGLDLSETALLEGKKRNQNALFVVGDIKALPFRKSSFEAVISLGVIEHFPEGPILLLKEMKRVLSRRGHLFVTVPYESIIRKLFHKFYILLGKFKMILLKIEYSFAEYRFSKEELTFYLKQGGFSPECIEYEELVCYDRSFALYVDWFRFFGKRRQTKEFELNRVGRVVKIIMRKMPPTFWYGGILCVARVDY